MNLQALTSLSKVRFFSIVGISLIIIGCNTGDKSVSGTIQPKGEVLSTIFRDDFELITSVMLYDTLISNNSQRILIGSYSDSIFGSVKSEAYCQFMNDNPFTNFGPNPKLDSTLLEISFTNYNLVTTALGAALQYSYGQKGGSQTIYFHRLTEDLDAKRNYTTRSELAYNPIPLGKLTFTNPVNAKIVIDNALGQEFLDNPDNFTTNASFINFFKGMSIVNGFSNTSIWGIASLNLILKYHNYYALNNLKVNETSTFSLTKEPTAKFSQITPDRNNGSLTLLSKSYDTLSSTQTQKACYIQSNTGIGTIVKFPFLDALRQSVNGKILVDRSQLVIKPEINQNFAPAPFLIAYELNSAGTIRKNNGVNVALQEQNNIFGFANPQLIRYDVQNSRYVIELTTYMQALIDKNELKPNNGLLLLGFNDRVQIGGQNNSTVNLFYSNINRTIFYNDKNSMSNIKLNMHYSPYQ